LCSIGNQHGVSAMKTLQMMIVGTLLATTAAWASADEESSVPTFTVTAKRQATALAVEHVAPSSAIEIAALVSLDMPEAEIDYRLSPFGAPPAPAVELTTL
jgi:hypothetical protein